MIDVKNMTFEEFISFSEKKVGKIDGQLKILIKIIYDNLKSGEWSETDLRQMTNKIKADRKICKGEKQCQ